MRWLTNLLSGSKNSEREIRNIFFSLIQHNNGSITVIDFAMAADLSGTDAKKILEQFAVEFDAAFDVTEEGQVIYLFPAIAKPLPNKPQEKSPVLESENSNKSPTTKESKNEVKSNFANLNDDIKQKVDNINNDVKQKVDSIKKIEDDLKEVGKSMNNLFKF